MSTINIVEHGHRLWIVAYECCLLHLRLSSCEFLLRVGDGVDETVHENFTCIPDDMLLNALINGVFPSLESNKCESDYIILHAILSTRKNYIILHAILSTRNDSVDQINDYLICRFHGK
uniref:Uncharacterized protein n=1 Tax=Lactuca sativa TaxID=4236 RepID=A0A9R1WJ35_LACSA|nr:hypothetical protein LSAT_V11C200059110 [Lactuca sativa]